ncbi:MAG TPA: farnesyl diphosphate synthase [Phycisphaerales bacterium]|nr:farnesyl diphosphate synthase [Phycisphaerales bacterium]
MNQTATHDLHTEAMDLLAGLAREVDAFIDAWLEQAVLPHNLREAVKYGVLGGGKRLRPALILLSAKSLGASTKCAMHPAAAMELIHCFSLVHDDLPAMDDDDLRRGQPTLHIHAGEAMAILAGDAMMSLAFELVAQAPLNDAARCGVLAELAQSTTAMIAGQVYDTLGGYAANLPDKEKLQIIHRNKTGALIRASCRIGAMCAGATSQNLDRLTRFGEAVGLMFQVVDDLLDVTQSSEHLGKRAGKDQDAGKLTFPGVIGVEASRKEVERLRLAAHASLGDLGDSAHQLLQVADALAVRTK